MILTVPPHPCVWRLVSPVSMILRSAREGSVSDRVTTTGDTASEAATLLAVTGGGASGYLTPSFLGAFSQIQFKL